MSEEPDFIYQNGERLTDKERREWFCDRAAEAFRHGAVLMRATIHPMERDLILLEGWRVHPKNQGEPRWQMQFAEDRI
jgi:hypothetical protein